MKALFSKYLYIDSAHLDVVAEILGISTPYFQKALRSIPWMGLAFNGTKHYRMIVDSPVRRWSMCMYSPSSLEDREEFVETLRYKGYEETKEELPLPFEYLFYEGRVCWLEPCDTGHWNVARLHQLQRKANLKKEQPADHHEGESEDHHLLESLLRTLKLCSAKAKKSLGGPKGTRGVWNKRKASKSKGHVLGREGSRAGS
jgi:hypothetical protein